MLKTSFCRRFYSLILGRPLDVVEDDDLDRNFCGFEFQPKIFLKRRGERRSLWGLGRPAERESIVGREPGPIYNLAAIN